MIRMSTVRHLRAIRREPERRGHPQLSVRFAVRPTDDELVEAADALGPPIPNPGRRTRLDDQPGRFDAEQLRFFERERAPESGSGSGAP
jgi:hypothetical protein